MKTISIFKNSIKPLRVLLLLGIILLPIILFSQPPAQGPPLPINQNKNISFSIVLGIVEYTIQTTLDSINAQTARKKDSTNVGAHLSYTYTSYKPEMVASILPDAPNQNEIHIAAIVTYTIDNITWHGIPYFSRTISQSIDIYVTCKNWFTNQGLVNISSKADRAFIDGHSFGESALDFFIGNYLTNYVDGKIRASLPGALQSSNSIPTSPCTCLGLNTGTMSDNHYKDGFIIFENRNLGPGNRPPTIYDYIDVNVVSIKRLTAHSFPGDAPLYNPVENIQLVFYANQTSRATQISQIKEEEVRNLNLGNIQLYKGAGYTSTVLIGKIDQVTGTYNSDSNFAVYYKDQSFGNGIQKIIITKSYWQQPQSLPGGGIGKPFKVTIPAYELTVNINAHSLPINNATNR